MMGMNSRIPSCLKRHVLVFLAGVESLSLWIGADPVQAQEVSNWVPPTGVSDPTNWFEPNNWAPALVPTAKQIVTVDTSTQTGGTPGAAPATIGPNSSLIQAAVANELLIGESVGVREVITLSTPGEVIVNGTSASLTLSGVDSLQVSNGSLQIQNGGTVNAQEVSIGATGQINIGAGGLSGTLNAATIANTGQINFDFTDATTLSAPISGTGQITKSGSGTLTLTGNNTYSGETVTEGGTVVAAATHALGNGEAIVFGPTSVLRISPGATEANFVTVEEGGTLENAGTLQLPALTQIQSALVTVESDGRLTNAVINELTGNIQATGTGPAILAIFRGDLDPLPQLPVTVTNAGTISGPIAISLVGVNGSVTNANTGVITGTSGTAIEATTGSVTLSNAGVIHGNVTLDNFPNKVTLFTGSQIVGTLNLGSPTAASFVIDGPGTQLLSQAVTGTVTNFNSLTKQGTGIWVIDQALTYAGGTTISAGTLQLGNGGTAGSITGDVIDDGLLVFDRSDTAALAGAITGTGSVGQIGIGTTILTGDNTYTGSTTVSAGTLQAGSTTGFSPNSAFLVNSILDLHGFNNTIGSLSGTGTVLNNGATAAALTVGNQNTSTLFDGVLENGSSVLQLIKSGTGTLTLTKPNTYTGSTTVNQGSLIVNGSIASLQTVVNSGGFLAGHGTIGSTIDSSLVNNGVVGQISSPGTLTVAGNFLQNPGGTLRIGLEGTAPSQFDLLAVNGHASVAGTVQLNQLAGFTLQPGQQITFLTAAKGVSGTFNSSLNGFVATGTIVQARVTSLPDSVVLEATQGSFQPVAQTPNESAVAKALDSAAGDPRAAGLFTFLDSQPLADLPRDLNLIAPAQITSINATAVSLGNIQMSNLQQRLANIRSGSTGFSSSGFSFNGGESSFGPGLEGDTGPEGKSGPAVFAPAPDNRWGVFLTGLGEFTNVSGTPNAAGYDVDTGGVTLGVDYRVCPNFAIGLTAGYAHPSVNLDGGGNIDINGGTVGLYATIFGNGFYLDTAVSGGPSGYNTHRAALQGSASGSTDGADVNVLVAGGYDWKRGNLTIGPTASFQYSYVGFHGFTETGSLAPLKFPDQNTESERTALGGKASYDWKIGHIHVIPEVSAAWQHEFGDTAYSIVAGFANGAGKPFTATGPQIGRDSLLIGAGATMIWNERVSTYLFYDGEVARTNYLSNNVSAGVRIAF
jgi:autotransporter-associated beta strand protein